MKAMRRACPDCRADLPEEPVEECPLCKVRLAPEPGTKLVSVISADSVLQAHFVKSMLEGSRIPTWIQGEFSHALWGGVDLWESKQGVHVVVSEKDEELARKVLCARGIVCQVTPGEVETLLQDHVLPAKRSGAEGIEKLIPILAMNKKEVLASVVRLVAEKESHGIRFLESVLAEAVEQGEEWLAARLADSLDGMNISGLPKRLAAVSDGERRALAASVISRLRRLGRESLGTLVDLLEDPYLQVRNEAIEGLFAMTEQDYGYEPEAPPEERARAIEEWRAQIDRMD